MAALLRKRGLELLLVLFVLAVLMLLYSYAELMRLGPVSTHQWRQCDCLAITQMYYQYNNPFLEPELLFIGPAGNGKCMPSEMPFLYYGVAEIWKVFGKNLLIYRLIDLVFLIVGMVALYFLFKRYLENKWLSIGLMALFFTSPIVAFYGISFISDASALFMGMAGSAAFFYFEKEKKWLFLYLSAFFFILAGWLKISAGISYGAISILLFTDLIGFSKFNLLPQGKKIKALAIWSLPFMAWLPWYVFAYYRGLNLSQGKMEFFLIGVLPIWDMDKQWILSTITSCFAHVKPYVFHRSLLLFMAIGQVSVFFLYAYSNRLVFWISNILIGLFVIYVLLFFQVFNVHDYYFLNMMVLPAFVLLNIVIAWKNYSNQYKLNKVTLPVFSLLLLFNIYYCSARVYSRIHTPKAKSIIKYVFRKDELDFWDWFHWHQQDTFFKLYLLKDQLPLIGIPKEEPIIVMGDQSINIALFMLEKRGFSSFMIGERRNKIDTKLYKHILFIGDQSKENDVIKPFIGEEIFRDGSVSICKTRPLIP